MINDFESSIGARRDGLPRVKPCPQAQPEFAMAFGNCPAQYSDVSDL
jgi:hypothetical protein